MVKKGTPGLCLNMIVKNEEKVIERCLSSVLPLINFFVILDTGSSDQTIQKIRNFFSKTSVRGIIKREEFKNFSHARNKALSLAYDFSPMSNILFIDADMEMMIGGDVSDIFKTTLTSYYITQGDGKIEYKNTRIIQNDRNYYYKGYTHEVLLPLHGKGLRSITIPKEKLYIKDHGDGGSKENKLDRDIHLLNLEISENPKYSRPYFYLANTYFGKLDFQNAEKYYRKRVTFGGWEEEIWYCYYKLAMIKIITKNIPEAIWFLFASIESHPNRLESYFHLLRLLLEQKMDSVFEMFRGRARHIYEKKLPTKDYLFYEKVICETELPKLFI